jgi:hypothetical protein
MDRPVVADLMRRHGVRRANADKNIGKRLYTVQAPDFEYAKAFVMADLAINGFLALEIEAA